MNNKNIQAHKIAGLINFILHDTTELKYAVIDQMNLEELCECVGMVSKLGIKDQMYLSYEANKRREEELN